MNHTPSYLLALIIAATAFLNVSTVFAQEWRALLGQGLSPQSQSMSRAINDHAGEMPNWLATQTPLLKNAPIKNVGPNHRPIEGLLLSSEYTHAGSWAPLPNPLGKDGFTLFSF